MVLEYGKHQNLPNQMRDLFVIGLDEVDLSDPKELFKTYRESMSEVFAFRLLPPDNVDEQLLKWMLLIDTQKRLRSVCKEVLFK